MDESAVMQVLENPNIVNAEYAADLKKECDKLKEDYGKRNLRKDQLHATVTEARKELKTL